MGLSGGRPGSYRRRLRRKYRKLRRRYAAGHWQAAGPSRAGQAPSHWPFADDRASQERPGYSRPGPPQAQRTRPRRARPRRARRREGLALGDLPASVIVTTAVGAVIVIAVAAGAVGVNQWVAAGDAANTTAAPPATPSSASSSAAASPIRSPTALRPESQRSPAARQSRTSQEARQAATAQPVVVVSQLTAGRGDAWPGLGPDWARPNPRRVLLRAMLNGVASDILHALLPDPYRSGWHPALCR
jgi:hypothetical protein